MNSATLRLRLGVRWLREGGAEPRDRVGLELHGLDLLSGAGNERLVAVLGDWSAALLRTCAGSTWSTALFEDAGWALVMERVDDSALQLHRAPLGAHPGGPPQPVRMALDELVSAVAAGVEGFVRTAQALPQLAADCARLAQAARQLRAAHVLPPQAARACRWVTAIRAEPPLALRLELQADGGALASGEPWAVGVIQGGLVSGDEDRGRVAAVPFALAMLDAADELSEGRGQPGALLPPGCLPSGGALPAHALARFAHDLAAALVHAHPPAADFPAIDALLSRSAALLGGVRAAAPTAGPVDAPFPGKAPAGRPLAAHGRRLKRVAYARTWRIEGVEGRSVALVEEQLAVSGTTGLRLFSGDGEPLYSLPADGGLALDASGTHAVANLGGRLVGLAGGPAFTARWIRSVSSLVPRGGLLTLGEHWCTVALGRGACGLSATTGRELWRVPLRGGAWLTPGAPRPWLATELGSLLALEPATGAVAAAVHGPLPYARPASLHGRRLSAVASHGGRSELTVVDVRSGAVLLRRPLALADASPALPLGRRWYLAGQRGTASVLVALTASGNLAWERPLPGPGPWRLATCAGGVLLSNRAGAAVCVEPDRRLRWTSGSAAPDECELAVPPVVRRGLAYAFGPTVRVLDAKSGEPLSELPLPAPARAACVAPSLSVYVLDEAGGLTAWALTTHLSAVR